MKCWNCDEENNTSESETLAEAWALLQDYLVSIGESASPSGPQDTPLGLLIESLRPS
jgi:hypothetical protein